MEKKVAARTAELRNEVEQRTRVEETLRQHEREKAIIEERNRLARELHDSVTQSLYGVTLYADAARRLLDTGQLPPAVENLNKLRDTARGALEEMRMLIFELRPPILEQKGLAAALGARLEAVQERVGLKTQLRLEGENQLPPDIQEGCVSHRPGSLEQCAQTRPGKLCYGLPDPGTTTNSEEFKIHVELMLCNGCRKHNGQIPIQKQIFGDTHRCAAYECSQSKGLEFCGDCDQFPCDNLHPYADKAGDLPHNIKVFNLCLINKMGLEKWAESKASEVRKVYFTKPWTLT